MLRTPTREELLQNYEYVDRVSLIESLSDAHVRVLRDDIDEWMVLMPILGMEEKEIKLIDLQEQREAMKRHMALHKWKRKFGRKATYLSFLNACMKMRNIALAERMLDLLNETIRDKMEHKRRTDIATSTPRAATSTPKRASTSTPTRANYDKSDKSASQTREESEQDILSLSYTSISSRGSAGSGLGDWLPTDQRIEELQMKYNAAIEEVSDYFKKKVTPQMIQKKLRLAPPELEQLKSFPQVNNSESDDIFDKVIAATDFQNIEILLWLVCDLGDNKCKEAMQLYEDDLLDFNVETTLQEYAKCNLHTVSHSGQEEILLIMSEKWETKTLQDLREFKRKLQIKAHFGSYDLNVCKVASACVEVTLALVSNSADICNVKLVETDFFRANHVLRVSVRNTIVYNVESPKNYIFINVPLPHFICPITKQIMLEPQKTQCCGKHTAREATLHHQTKEQPCPFCLSARVESKPDLVLREKTRAVKIYCPYKQEGCHWEGEIRYLSKHLHGEENRCQYTLLECPYSCGSSMQRPLLKKHLPTCKVYNSPLTCRYCGTEHSRATPHLDECPRLPVDCPYECAEQLERENIPSHLKICPKLQTKPRQLKALPTEQTDYGIDLPHVKNEAALDTMFVHEERGVSMSTESDLLIIARKMLDTRLKLPDIWINLIKTRVSLIKIKLEGNEDGSESNELEKLNERELELTIEDEVKEKEMAKLRNELLRVHREKNTY